MNRLSIIAALFALISLGGQSALAQSGYDLFQKGLVQERVKGDLDEAIRLYKQIAVQGLGPDRPLRPLHRLRRHPRPEPTRSVAPGSGPLTIIRILSALGAGRRWRSRPESSGALKGHKGIAQGLP